MGDIHNILLRAFAQATESRDRVKTALSLFVFDNEIGITLTEGYFGNQIIILQARLKERDCGRFAELIRSKLSEQELRKLKGELYERIDDDCILHIRFDKQAAYAGQVKLAATADSIMAQIKIRAYPARMDKAAAVAEKILSDNR